MEIYRYSDSLVHKLNRQAYSDEHPMIAPLKSRAIALLNTIQSVVTEVLLLGIIIKPASALAILFREGVSGDTIKHTFIAMGGSLLHSIAKIGHSALSILLPEVTMLWLDLGSLLQDLYFRIEANKRDFRTIAPENVPLARDNFRHLSIFSTFRARFFNEPFSYTNAMEEAENITYRNYPRNTIDPGQRYVHNHPLPGFTVAHPRGYARPMPQPAPQPAAQPVAPHFVPQPVAPQPLGVNPPIAATDTFCNSFVTKFAEVCQRFITAGVYDADGTSTVNEITTMIGPAYQGAVNNALFEAALSEMQTSGRLPIGLTNDHGIDRGPVLGTTLLAEYNKLSPAAQERLKWHLVNDEDHLKLKGLLLEAGESDEDHAVIRNIKDALYRLHHLFFDMHFAREVFGARLPANFRQVLSNLETQPQQN